MRFCLEYHFTIAVGLFTVRVHLYTFRPQLQKLRRSLASDEEGFTATMRQERTLLITGLGNLLGDDNYYMTVREACVFFA